MHSLSVGAPSCDCPFPHPERQALAESLPAAVRELMTSLDAGITTHRVVPQGQASKLSLGTYMAPSAGLPTQDLTESPQTLGVGTTGIPTL